MSRAASENKAKQRPWGESTSRSSAYMKDEEGERRTQPCSAREGLRAAFSHDAWTGAVSERLCSIVSSVFLQGGDRYIYINERKQGSENKETRPPILLLENGASAQDALTNALVPS